MVNLQKEDYQQILYDALFYKHHHKSLYLRLIARLTGGRVVLVQDYDGECAQTISYKVNSLPEGTLFAYRFPTIWAVGPMVLLSDGNTSKPSVNRWRFL